MLICDHCGAKSDDEDVRVGTVATTIEVEPALAEKDAVGKILSSFMLPSGELCHRCLPGFRSLVEQCLVEWLTQVTGPKSGPVDGEATGPKFRPVAGGPAGEITDAWLTETLSLLGTNVVAPRDPQVMAALATFLRERGLRLVVDLLDRDHPRGKLIETTNQLNQAYIALNLMRLLVLEEADSADYQMAFHDKLLVMIHAVLPPERTVDRTIKDQNGDTRPH